jgi:uncharacterized membrane protein YfcA
MILGSIAGVIAGIIVATRSPDNLIKLLFGIFLFFMFIEGVLRLPRKGKRPAIDELKMPGIAGLSVLGFVMGLLGTLLGIGGGVIATPVQHSFFKLPLKSAIANSLATIIVSASLGAVLYFVTGAGQIFAVGEALITAAAVVPGSMAGAKVSTIAEQYLPERYIKYIFYAVVLYMAYNMIKSGMGW